MANEITLQSTKLRSRKPNWSELPIDPCETILSKLTPKSILRFKAVCPSWKRAVQFILMSSSFTDAQEPPWLLLHRQDGHCGFRFYSFEGKTYNLNKNMPEVFGHSVCFASDQGWLLLLVFQKMNFSKLLLFNPLSGTQLLLPPLRSFPDILYIVHNHDEDSSKIHIKITNPDPTTPPQSFCLDITSAVDIKRKFITKAVILSSRPILNSNNKSSSVGVFVMYRYVTQMVRGFSLAFCKTEDDEWTKLDEQIAYQDITSYENQLYALCCDHTTVQVWDLVMSSFPVKKLEIKVDASSIVLDTPTNWYRIPYIIKTGVDDLFLVVRLFDRSFMEPTVLHIYKRDSNDRWMAVDSIGDHALVLGLTQQSISISSKDLPEYDQNSIYFTSPFKVKNQCRFGLFGWRNKGKEVCVGNVPLGMFLFVPNPFSRIRAS
ncbi:hypothetical protein ACLB2K_040726 [Fragaria x ananassa]